MYCAYNCAAAVAMLVICTGDSSIQWPSDAGHRLPDDNAVRGAGGGDSSVTINLNGNVLGTDEFVRDTLIPQIENAVGRNLA